MGVRRGAASLAAYDWTFDAAGQITSATSVGGTVTYACDGNDQLTEAEHTNPALTDETFAWEGNGNPSGTGITVSG